MTPRDLATEAELRRATEAAFRRASERAKNSPDGMVETAQALRQNAARIRNSCDRDTMLRLAADYERRADEARRRLTLSRPSRAVMWHG